MAQIFSGFGIFVKTAAASFVKFGLLFIPTSGHTENKRKSGLEWGIFMHKNHQYHYSK